MVLYIGGKGCSGNVVLGKSWSSSAKIIGVGGIIAGLGRKYGICHVVKNR